MPPPADRITPTEGVPVAVRSAEGRAILEAVGRLHDEIHAQVMVVAALDIKFNALATRVDSMRPKLASMPEEAKEIAELAIDHRELEDVRRHKKIFWNLFIGIVSALVGTTIWEAWLRPLLHR